jgi:NAD(P)-dependent dehydrogenase (short-subunit alcohol dehydrogenase family)
MLACFRTNAAGAYAVATAFAVLLSTSPSLHPRLVNITSGLGSIALRLDPADALYETELVPYRVSKAAMNMVSACLMAKYKEKG